MKVSPLHLLPSGKEGARTPVRDNDQTLIKNLNILHTSSQLLGNCPESLVARAWSSKTLRDDSGFESAW
jgi:hypothetical protein